MDPATLFSIAQLTIGGITAIFGAKDKVKQQNAAAEANRVAALQSEAQASKDISLQELQQSKQSGQTVFEADRSARATQALTRVSAGEAGVSGISVEALLSEVDRKIGEFHTTQGSNLAAALDSLQREKVSGRTVAQGRIAQVQPTTVNPFAIGINLASNALTFWQGAIERSTTKTANNTP